jgi:uncharacterized MAPEG superfamily protein
MTIAYWCILIVAVLPYICAGMAKFAFGSAQGDGYDKHDPRAWLARRTGAQARAHAAQLNGFEALPFFIGAVLLAHQLHAPQGRVDTLAAAFVVSRLLYIGAYIANWPSLRSWVWIAGIGINIALFCAGM